MGNLIGATVLFSAELLRLVRKLALLLHNIKKMRGISTRFVVAYVTAFCVFKDNLLSGLTSKFGAKKPTDLEIFKRKNSLRYCSRIKPCLATENHIARQRRAERHAKISPCLAGVDFRNLESHR